MAQTEGTVKSIVDTFEITDECLSSRAGLTLISRYLRTIGIAEQLARMFSFVRKRQTGASLAAIFTQILLYFFDGTEFHLTRFDHLKADAGYAASIETAVSEMLSSHVVKRFFTSITIVRVWLFRRVLRSRN